MRVVLIVIVVLAFIRCSVEENGRIMDIENPAGADSEASNLFQDEEGELYLSWIEMLPDSSDGLYVSRLKSDAFKEKYLVASGNDWFVNWADFPSFAKFENQDTYVVSWLQKSAKGTYDYDIHVAISKGDLQSWNHTFILNQDGIDAEHGFLSLHPEGNEMAAVWLDGRNTKVDFGAMMLRYARFDSDGSITHEEELDYRICDCCQTDFTIFDDTKYVVYRDRSMEEYRDNVIKIGRDSTWSKPIQLDTIHWKTSSCPVNGPAIASSENYLATLSYMQNEQDFQVGLNIYDRKRMRMDTSIILNDSLSLGRFDIKFSGDQTLVIIWMEYEQEQNYVMHGSYDISTHNLDKSKLWKMDERRKSGFPRMVVDSEYCYINYTQVTEDEFRVSTKRVVLN